MAYICTPDFWGGGNTSKTAVPPYFCQPFNYGPLTKGMRIDILPPDKNTPTNNLIRLWVMVQTGSPKDPVQTWFGQSSDLRHLHRMFANMRSAGTLNYSARPDH